MAVGGSREYRRFLVDDCDAHVRTSILSKAESYPVVNLGLGGIQFISFQTLKVDQRLHLSLKVGDQLGFIKTSAIVRWFDQIPGERAFRVGAAFFKLPKDEQDGQIFFEGAAKLFGPDGRPWKDGKPQRGWVTLPGDQPGLWSFLPTENEIVGSRNIPPFFAAESASSYFEPDIPWTRRPAAEARRADAKQVFTAGAIRTPGNQGIHLTGKRLFQLQGGPPHASGDGLRFLPFKKGTIEFWMKPNWHTCGLRPEGAKCLINMNVARGQNPWSVWHNVKPRSRNAYNDFLFSHVLYGWMYTDGLAKKSTLRRYRRTIFEPGQWYHVAWVWGHENGLVPGNPPYHTKVRDNVLVGRIFVNGKQGRNTGYQWYKNEPFEMPLSLDISRGYVSANLDAVVDELRVSDTQRYRDDFQPSRKEEFQLDEHTRALFHFNGDMTGASWGVEGKVLGTLRK